MVGNWGLPIILGLISDFDVHYAAISLEFGICLTIIWTSRTLVKHAHRGPFKYGRRNFDSLTAAYINKFVYKYLAKPLGLLTI